MPLITARDTQLSRQRLKENNIVVLGEFLDERTCRHLRLKTKTWTTMYERHVRHLPCRVLRIGLGHMCMTDSSRSLHRIIPEKYGELNDLQRMSGVDCYAWETFLRLPAVRCTVYRREDLHHFVCRPFFKNANSSKP